MARKTWGVVLFAVFAMMAMAAQGVIAGQIGSLTACLKIVPGEPLGTAVYTEWDNDVRRLEITVTDAEPGNYCIFVDKVKLDAKIVVDDTRAGYLRLDTRWGDVIPPIVLGSKISLKNCADTTIVLCGSFQ